MAGSRDADFDAKRAALIGRVRDRLAAAGDDHPSFRQLADAAGVSEATLRHYFRSLPELVTQVIEWHANQAAPYLERLAQPSGPFADSIEAALRFIAAGERQPVNRALHSIGATEGTRRPRIRDTYRRAILEPVLEAVRRRLEAHVEAGEMRRCNTRLAVLILCAPVLMAFQHGANLDGELETLDADELLAEQRRIFVDAYMLPNSSSETPAR